MDGLKEFDFGIAGYRTIWAEAGELVEPAIQDMSVVNVAVPNLGRRRTVPGERGAGDATILRSLGERQATLRDVGGQAAHGSSNLSGLDIRERLD